MNGKAEPRFDIDLKYGVQGELHVEQLLNWIIAGEGKVEVKRKRLLDLYFYIETDCDKGRQGVYQPSGIQVTTASTWFFTLGDTGITVSFPTELLRSMLDDASSKDREEKDGSCPTRGKLINLAVILFRYQKRQEAARNVTPVQPAIVVSAERKTVPVMHESEIDWGYSDQRRTPKKGAT